MYILRQRHEEKTTYISLVSKTVVLDMVSSKREELEKDVDTEKDSADRKHTHFYRFNDYDKVISLIEKLPLNINVPRDKERSLGQLSLICNSYQEQPHLIDPFLGEIFAKIATIITQCIDQHAALIKSEQDRETKSRLEKNDALINQAFKYMYTLAIMRNCKRATEFLPRATKDLDRLLSLLERQNAKDANSRQTRFMLLLWLSAVGKNSIGSDAKSESLDEILADRVLNICFPYLYATDNCQDASAFMLAKFMPRTDLGLSVLPKFIDKLYNLINQGINESDSIKLLGSLKCLGYLYKYGKREMLREYARTTLKVVMAPTQLASNHLSIVRKFHVKLVQRIGVTFFPLSAAKWRYERSLHKVTDAAQDTSSSDKIQDQKGDEKEPAEIEDIINLILKGLKDRDTKLRWSSAKSLARITNCLSKDRAEGVLASVVALFKLDDEDLNWHGGCLAIAELCHNGLVLPLQLSSVVPVILKALLLDQKVGNYTLGRNVREYACYVCWTLARVFETDIIQPFTNQITNCLLMVTLFDPDINCRQTASAAFQEMIGRHGRSAYDVEIVTNCDLFAVGRIQNCYLNLSVFVAQFGDYRHLIFDHLLQYKFNHWDHSIRELTSQALFNLSKTDPEYMTSEIVPALLKHSLSTDVNTRHGALLSLAEMVDAISKDAVRLSTTPEEHLKLFNRFFTSSLVNEIRDMLSKLFDRKCRGSEAELIRPAICFLVKKLVMSQLFNQPITNQTSNCSRVDQEFIRDLGEFLDQCLEDSNQSIQAAAVETIPYYCDLKFAKSYDNSSVDVLLVKESKMIEKFTRKLISTSKQTIRSGYCLAIGSLPRYFLQVDGNFVKAVDVLIESCKIKPLYSLQIDKYFRDESGEPVKSHVGTVGNVDYVNVWVQARKDAITALIKLLGLLKTKQDFELFGMSSNLLFSLFDSMLTGLNDYTIDSSGDSGSKVREASIVALQVLIEQCGECGITDLANNETLLISIFAGIIQQAVERIDRTRNVAGTAFAKILYSKHLRLQDFGFSKNIRTVFHEHVCKAMNWNAAHLTSPLFVKLLEVEAVQARLLSGLIYSMGSLSIHLVKSVTTAFLKELQSLKIKKEPEFRAVMSRLLDLARSKIGSERYALSIIKVVDLVIQNNLLGEHLNQECHFPVEFLNLFIENVKTAKDVQKLTAYVDAFADMLQFVEDRVRERAMIQLMILLCNQYPSIRKATATKLYEALISYSEIVVDEENLDECTTLLMETSWDRPLDTVRPVRDRLCEMTNTPKPVVKKKTQ